ncbi:hypothetical protein E2C01_027469 [Portunus trituberculatus]|uniref:Uncharacterized protein n=1 Tax=Portunus trituberculatus TaxID=210409 RepID=A0A5B7EI73_PORTR|nr:hypothetical protein [Portunus trituberculatus]
MVLKGLIILVPYFDCIKEAVMKSTKGLELDKNSTS